MVNNSNITAATAAKVCRDRLLRWCPRMNKNNNNKFKKYVAAGVGATKEASLQMGREEDLNASREAGQLLT